MSSQSESILVERLCAGDGAAWSELIRDYSGLLMGLAGRTFGAHGFHFASQDAEDVVAGVWRNLLERENRLLEQCRIRGGLLPLLVTLSRNRAVDLMRRHKNFLVPLHESQPEPQAPDSEGESLPDSALLSPELFEILSPREKTCIRLFYLQGKKYREIERLTGISINSIGPTLKRALAKLKENLGNGSRGEDFVRN
jgi:RNA polymerase sigma factor (sigma-70 family)